MPLDGTLRDMSLPALVQLQCSEQRRALVQLTRGSREGTLLFEDGALVLAQLGALHGEDAVYEMLRWDDAKFHVTDEPTFASEPNISTPWQSLMMEGLRRADEAKLELQEHYARIQNVLSASPQVTAWTFCHADGFKIDAQGELQTDATAAWAMATALRGERIGAQLKAGMPQEITLSIAQQKFVLVPYAAHWLLIVMRPRGQMDELFSALARAQLNGDNAA